MDNSLGNFFSDSEEEIITLINNLDKKANACLLQIEDLHKEDLYFMSIIDKTIKLIDNFLFALEKRNITVLATLTRVQMDCALRAFAPTLVSNSSVFCDEVLIKKKQINKIKDVENKNLTDKYLCKKLEARLNLPIYDLYQKVCGFVHFSSLSFNNIARTEGENKVSFYISRVNRTDEENEYLRLSIELANQFYYFGCLLIEYLFSSWLLQLRNEKKVHIEE